MSDDDHKRNWLDRILSIFGSDKEPDTWHDRLREEGLSESDKFLLNALPFAFEKVPGNEALEYRAKYLRNSNVYPIIAGSDENLMRVTENWSFDQRPSEEILAKAESLSHPDCLFKMRDEATRAAREYLSEHGIEDSGEDYSAPIGEWPDSVDANNGPSGIRDVLTGEFADGVNVLMMPTTVGHQIPGLLKWGGWNDCPPPEYHVAALRSWNQRYGAQLVTLSADVIELQVTRRPSTREEALALANEQYSYCGDIVDQGVGELSALAAILMESDWWFFWWD